MQILALGDPVEYIRLLLRVPFKIAEIAGAVIIFGWVIWGLNRFFRLKKSERDRGDA